MNHAVDAREVFRIHRSAEGDAAALQGLNLQVGPGEVVAVIGPSGSGKSTLLRILAALETPSAGTVRVLGQDVATLRHGRGARFRSRRLGLVDQHYGRALPPDLRCSQIVSQGMALLGAPSKTRADRAADLLSRVGLPGAGDARPSELSGGEQQRVAVCAALAHRPDLLLADEPGGELDTVSATAVYQLIGELAREHGSAVVMVTHDPAATAIADRTVQIRDGRLSDETQNGQAAIVVGRGGWLRVPEHLLVEAGIGGRAQASLHQGDVVLRRFGEAASAAAPASATRAASADPAAGPAAQLKGIAKSYGAGRLRRQVLDGLSHAFPTGRLSAVVGRSGSGKTTVLRLLAGLELPDAGEVRVLGEQLAGRDRSALADFRREYVACVAQEPDLVAMLTAVENVALGLSVRGVAPAEADEAARTWLIRVGLEQRLDHRVTHLSGGERQRVAIARALSAQPQVMLVDEPTSRLDQVNAGVVGRLLADAAAEHGICVVAATHDPLLIDVCDERLALEA